MEKSDWEPTTNRFVAFFDILGFKAFVSQNKHEEVLKHLNRIKQATQYAIDGKTKEKMIMKTPLRSFQFSDTILIFSASDTIRDLLGLLFLSRIFLGASIMDKIPLKGAISCGLVTADFDEYMFLGQPIIDAYLLQEKLQLCGAVMDSKSEEKLKEFENTTGFKERIVQEIARYDTPTKTEKLNCFNLRWPRTFIPPNEDNPNCFFHTFERNSFVNLYSDVIGEPRKYVENTMDYMGYLIGLVKTEYPGIKEWELPYKFHPDVERHPL